MKPDDFKYLHDQIYVIGEGLQDRYREKAKIEWKEDWKTPLEEYYEAARSHIKQDVMKAEDGELMDRHKIAAAITISVMKTAPLTTKDDIRKLPAAVWHINTQLAIAISTDILLDFLSHEQEPDPEVTGGHSFPSKNDSLEWPPAKGGEHYARHFAKELGRMFFDQQENGIYMLPNVYFLLEAFHREKTGQRLG
jgi:hypothetical protein